MKNFTCQITRLAIFCIALFTFSCVKEDTYKPSPAALAGKDSLNGTKWILYQYMGPQMTVPQSRNDTLIFQTATLYLFNGISSNYRLYNNSYFYGDKTYSLSLFGTSFGDIGALHSIPLTFKSHGELIDGLFVQNAYPTNLSFRIWLKKI